MGNRIQANQENSKRNRCNERTDHTDVRKGNPGRKQKPKTSFNDFSQGYAGIIDRFFSKLKYLFRNIKDPRKKQMVTYPSESLLWEVLCLFQTHTESRRQFEAERNKGNFSTNLKILSGTETTLSAHVDTMNYLMKKLNPEELQKIIRCNVNHLIRSKTLDQFRFDGQFLVAVDGVCFASFKQAHCEYCLRRTSDGVTTYFHYALVAMIVSTSGFVIPIEVEFIENTPEKGKALSELDNEFKKQDCELKAFYRLANHLKEHFPRLGITLLLDGLYANQQVIDICEKNRWDYFITLQNDSLPALQKEIEENFQKHPENMHVQTDDTSRYSFRWTTPIKHAFQKNWGKIVSSKFLFVLEETDENLTKHKKNRFVYLSSRKPNRHNIMELIHEGARQRWKIENQTFNTLKNHGMELQHAYGKKENCLKNYFLFRLIALSIEQFMVFSNGLVKILFPDMALPSNERGIKLFGSLKQMARCLLESLQYDLIKPLNLVNMRFSIPTG